MEMKPGYKLTTTGLIPEDWEERTLGNFVALQRGHDLTERERRRGDVPVMGSAGQNGFHDTALVRGPGVVIGRSGASFGQAHYCARDYWPHNTALYVTDFLGSDALFAFYFLKGIDFRRHNSGGAQQSLNRNFISPISVAVPKRQEQESIAEALSDADALIESLEKLVAKKRELRQGTLQELLIGKTRLEGFEYGHGYKQSEAGLIPSDWELEFIENVADITTGSRNTQDRVDEGQYPFFVRSQTIERINSYSFDGEAVLTAGDGVGTGKVFHYINGKFDAHQRVYRISGFSQKLHGYFFYLYFSSHFFGRIMQMTAKSSVDSVRREMIARMVVPIPPIKAEQEAIATVLFDMDAEIVALETKLAKFRQLKQAMMHELLTGRVRLA
jgi:type I restriction enzyme, S subunit